MRLVDELMKVGGKLGVVTIVSTTAAGKPGKVPTRKVTLKELATEVQADDLRKLSEMPPELSMDFANIFEAAGIKPPASGWNVDRLQKVLSMPQYKTMDRAAVQQALLNLLTVDKAHVHELVQDAMARDKAIDSFEEFTRKKVDERSSIRQRQVDDLQAQIAAIQAQVEALRREAQTDKDQWKKWHDRKIQYEKDMAAAISYLVTDSVITIDHDHD